MVIKYRLIKESDLDQLIAMADIAWGYMKFNEIGFSYNPETVRKKFASTIDKKIGCTIIGTKNDKVVGYLSIFLSTSPTNSDDIVAVEGQWNTAYDLPKEKQREIMEELVKLGMNYARNKKAKSFMIPSNIKFPGASKILVKLGFKPQEIAHYYKF